jgi:hypothetical protein
LSTRKGFLVATALLVAVTWVAWQALWAHGADRSLGWVDLTKRTLAQPEAAGLRVFQSRSDLEDALRSATVPAIDFDRRTAILVSTGPRSSSAYELDVVSVVEQRRRIVVTVRERTPSIAVPGTPTLAYPFRLITIDRSRKPVVLHRKGRP